MRFLPLVLAGCGLSDGKLLRELAPDQVAALCGESDEATYACDQVTVTVGGSACLDQVHVDPACTATVGDWRDCDEALRAALDADPCADAPAECDWLAACESDTTPGAVR
jgi:hypothetical protein